MSRKHNCPKRGRRSKSRYPERLARRGLRSAPQMENVETLRARQSRRIRPWAGDDGETGEQITAIEQHFAERRASS